ncbi:MAG: bifunctional lysylphosphatidylglycerol flippase/synthetase MprF [Novosphingobium sp.]
MPQLFRQIQSLLHENRTAASAALALLLAALGFYALHRLLLEVHLDDVGAALQALKPWQIGEAVAFTTISYLLLTLYDVLALKIIGKSLPWRTAALASFTSYTLSHNLGLGLLTGGSARYRIYSAKGLSAADIARIIATAGLAFWAGVVVTAAAALTLYPTRLAIGPFVVTPGVQRAVGLGVLAGTAWLMAKARAPGRKLRIFNWHLPLPTAGQALSQIGVAGLDLAVASAALYVLVPGADIQLFPQFFLGYALAIVVALLTHVPGGIGVFEAVIVAALPNLDRSALLAALVAYRAVYYLLPLLLAAAMLVIHEQRTWRGPFGSAVRISQSVLAGISPVLLSALTFVGGAILLVSGSLPAIPQRLHILRHIAPLPFVEASHISASLAGTGLLLLAPGLFKRLDGAFILTRSLLVAGAVFSIAKGFDFEEASILLLIAGLLQWSRRSFYRRTAFTIGTFSPGWFVAVGVALGLSLWIGLFSYKHVDYQSELWWQFAWNGDTSRFLRASFCAAVLLIAAIVVRFGNPAAQRGTLDEVRFPDGRAAFAGTDRADAMLAWTGDKRFLHSQNGKAFLMYQVQGHSWIVMGDPVGPQCEWPDLLWRIRERADTAQGRLLLYQISARTLPIAIDLGLQLVKYGEEARVDLARFTMDGSDARGLRYAERRAIREGARFAIIPAAQVAGFLPELRAVSDGWLKAKGHAELAFSVGRFDSSYLTRFDCAVVRHEGRIVAFANIWATANHNELSVDLMRHADSMPYGTMDLLFANLMRWGRDNGYRWFVLGVAPLSGIEARRLAPVWARASALLYRHGDRFYGFSGLRAYKEKFSPVWEPRFIAGPNSLALARAMLDLRILVGGGRRSAARNPMPDAERSAFNVDVAALIEEPCQACGLAFQAGSAKECAIP